MTIAKQSGSKFHRTWKCPASAVLPHDFDELAEETTEPARDKGKAIHRYLELVHTVGEAEAIAAVPENVRTLCLALDIASMPVHCATEVVFAYDWRTRKSRELGRNLGHRDYHTLPNPPTDDEIPSTIDVVGQAQFTRGDALVNRGYIADYKSGHTKYPRPGQFGQTLLGGLSARSLLGVEDVVLELIHIHADGDHHIYRDVVDEWTLDAFADEVEVVMGSLPQLDQLYRSGVGLPMREGRHCDYCHAYKHCDAKVALVRSIPGELVKLGVRPGTNGLEVAPGAVTVRSAAAAFEAAENIEAVLRRLKEEVCKMAWTTPIELSDGRVIEPRTSTRRSVDGKVAAAVLGERYSREEVMKAISIEISLDAIRATVVNNTDMNVKPRPKMTTQKGDGVVDLVIAEIAARGGITEKTTENCKPYQPRKKK